MKQIEVEMLIENKDGYKRWFTRKMTENQYKEFEMRVGDVDPKGYALIRILKKTEE